MRNCKNDCCSTWMDIISTPHNIIIVGIDQLTLRFIAIIALVDLDTYFNAHLTGSLLTIVRFGCVLNDLNKWHFSYEVGTFWHRVEVLMCSHLFIIIIITIIIWSCCVLEATRSLAQRRVSSLYNAHCWGGKVL